MNAAADATPHATILVIDDEPDLRALYELTLLREGHQVTAAGSVGQARAELAARRFDVVITDMRLPDGLGIEVLREMAAHQRPERCIVITAYGSAENAVEALKCGAFDYLTKPVDLKQFRTVVRAAIGSAPGATAPPASIAPLPEPSATPPDGGVRGQQALARLVGNSAPMRAVKQRVEKVARSMAPVLVRGESGTGKELVAKALHASSHRGNGPFVAVNCGAIPENLLEAEFFGARKGSYTGAQQDRDGFFQAASGGTLFLDEIGDLPLAMQAKLLRAIQERRVRPLGETHEEPVNVRIVSATHKDLAAEVQAGQFRQDLFYRLNVIEIVVPPLRERLDDLPALCDALLRRIAQDTGLPTPPLSERQLRQIAASPLAGNVRELENLLHRAVALQETAGEEPDAHEPLATPPATVAAPDPAPPSFAPDSADPPGEAALEEPLPDDLQAWLDAQERQVLVRALNATGFNRTAAAARLGLNLRQIRYRMARLEITAPSNGTGGDDLA
jgi:two-component system response regulator PilR (NtrC family)